MDETKIVDNAKTKFADSVNRFQESLKSLRTGRASASMLDGVMVDAYGTQMPLNQTSSVSAPEAQLLQVTPFDPSNISAISTAIRNHPNLGLNPTDDGRVVRVQVPPLTEERRRELAKQVGQKQEEAMISLRNVRHDALDAISAAKKDGMGEDQAKRLNSQIEESMNSTRSEIEQIAKSKEAEILKV